jgi:uncharacterized protein YbaR (Trm112 family)
MRSRACIDFTQILADPRAQPSYNLAIMIPPDLLEILVCPTCKKPLVLKVNPEALKCDTCRRVYPVRDNVPVLMVDEATLDPS